MSTPPEHLRHQMDALAPQLDNWFRQQERTQDGVATGKAEVNEVDFGHLTLGINDSPSAAIIILNKGVLVPLVEPRLELHLNEDTCDRLELHNTKRQLGRIARYIADAQLTVGFPVITTTTYFRLSQFARTIFPQMNRAVLTYFPPTRDGFCLRQGILDALEQFNYINETLSDNRLESLYTPTNNFVNAWQDQPE